MFHVIGRSLGSDGSVMYQTVIGDFFLYPKQNGGTVMIWELAGKPRVPFFTGRFNDMVKEFATRRGALGWIDSALRCL